MKSEMTTAYAFLPQILNPGGALRFNGLNHDMNTDIRKLTLEKLSKM